MLPTPYYQGFMLAHKAVYQRSYAELLALAEKTADPQEFLRGYLDRWEMRRRERCRAY